MKGRKKRLKDDPEIKKLEAKTRVLEAKAGMTLALFGTVTLELLSRPRTMLVKPKDEDQPDPGEELLNWREKAEAAEREEAKKEVEAAKQEETLAEWLPLHTAPENTLVLLLVDAVVAKFSPHGVVSGYDDYSDSTMGERHWVDVLGCALGWKPLAWLPFDTLPRARCHILRPHTVCSGKVPETRCKLLLGHLGDHEFKE